ncbi:adenosylcobinamide-GDP ribazoletransferase [Halorarum halobium]|uniref:adenosylcobinamide-GDP ribazoletransferase n=1 Tax=Halorarum halobium TaxID=3075121 RepID=UPI0028A79DCB|nr:adenosylcobinamide-GDP ribazoletransferase [Halobaculum sp. XH14]
MVLTALRGALGFLSRLPVGHDDEAWAAFARTPSAFPFVGYVLGPLVALPLLLPVPPATAALLFVVGVAVVTGINHFDGVADLGDAAVVHGPTAERREVMRDTVVGVGGAVAIAVIVLGLATAGAGLVGLPARALPLVVAAEVAAKAAMATVVCLGSATHEGLGSALSEHASARSLVPVLLLAAPAALLTWPGVVPAAATLATGPLVALLVLRWARATLGGVSGDVIGATNELARVAALHVGVVAWTLS